MKRWWLALMLGGLSAAAVASPADVEAVERARFAALAKADYATVEKALADDLVYCHSTSRCDTKASFLASLRSGALAYKEFDVKELRVRLYGTTAIVNGSIAVKVESNGKPNAFALTYTDVYVQRDGRWQLVSWQSTRVP